MRASRNKRRTLAVTLWAIAATASCADAPMAPTDSLAPPTDPALTEINDDYVRSVKPLFARSCAACHGAGKALPWYHAVPWVRAMIDDDIAKARRDLDMSHDFPFRGRGTPADYLDAIHDVVAEGAMPPLRYRVVHWGSQLDAEERARVLSWVARGQQRLRRRAASAAH